MKVLKHITLCLLVLPFVGMAQTYDVKRANEFFDRFDYPEAINRYERIKSKEDHYTIEVARNLATSYRKTLNYESAEMYYKEVVGWEDQSLVQAEDLYYYARMLQANGKYDASVPWMDKFMTMSANDTRALQNKGYSVERIQRLNENPEKFDIRKAGINSDMDDFGPVYYSDDMIVYTSNKAFGGAAVNRTYKWDGKPFLNMYTAKVDSSGSLSEPELFVKDYKTKYHEGPATFSRDFNMVVFTRNHLKKKGLSEEKINNLQLMYAVRDSEGNWMEAEPLPFNSNEYSCGHPSLSADGKRLYFASNMPGGYGGADIWISYLTETGEWSIPSNAGPMVNTAGNEMFPFVHSNGNLFFSSDGHFGLGGLDIFMSRYTGKFQFEKAVNLGAPLNGARDDFSVVLNEDLDFGYFASNRDTGNTGDDIYKFVYDPQLRIEVVVTDNETKEKLDSANVKVIVVEGNSLLDSALTDENGKIEMDVEETAYAIIVSAEGYDADTIIYEPEFDGAQTLFTVAVALDPAPLPMFYVGKVLDVGEVLFDRDKYVIRDDAALILDSVASIMEDNPGMHIECRSFTDCRHSADYNEKLSQKRAEASMKYLIKKGIDMERLTANGYGETELIADCPCECEQSIQEIGIKQFRDCEDEQVSNCTEEQHEMNRRTEFKITAMEDVEAMDDASEEEGE
jgi:outer membrane protein OmpA-like peptidoglycan-associated protein